MIDGIVEEINALADILKKDCMQPEMTKGNIQMPKIKATKRNNQTCHLMIKGLIENEINFLTITKFKIKTSQRIFTLTILFVGKINTHTGACQIQCQKRKICRQETPYLDFVKPEKVKTKIA